MSLRSFAYRSRTSAIYAATFVFLLVWTWRKWPDPVIDFGRELYVPWQIASGKVLYLDVASVFGPFSQYLNALCFVAFGTSLTTIIVVNLVILVAMIVGIHTLFKDACDSATATAAGMSALVLFGFSQYVPVGNYNYITPYSHEASHSIALSIGTIIALSRGVRARSLTSFVVAGTLTGCVLLTKVETSVALIVASLTAMIGATALSREDGRFILIAGPVFACSSLLAPTAFVLYFSRHMPLSAAFRAVAGSWPTLLGTGIANSPFYVAGSGMDAPARNAIRMLEMFGGVLAFVFLACLADRKWPSRPSRWLKAMWRVGRLLLLAASFVFIPWSEVPRALPLTSLLALVILLARFRQSRTDRPGAIKLLSLLMWSVFALALLAKMTLNARIYHYGVFLALPATLLLIATVVWLIPQLLTETGTAGSVFRSLAILELLVFVGFYLTITMSVYRFKHEPIGVNGDRFYAFGPTVAWQGRSIAETLAVVHTMMPADATIAVLPEGPMINYQSRHPNPTPYINLMPPELIAFGEGPILQSLRATPPDYVIFVYRDESEYGVPPFGTSVANGALIMRWIDETYRSVKIIGEPPRSGRHGIEILERRGRP